MPENDAWAEVTNPDWEPEFSEERVGPLLRLTGKCPRCTHLTTTDYKALTLGVERGGRVKESATIFCKCGYPHDGHPDGDPSCGAYWTAEVEL